MDEYPEFSFRKPYTLLAQTPMIHFQPGTAGVALRASEVKPKLDRYLRKQYGKEVPASWKIPGQPNALNYKMRITAVGEDKRGRLTIKDCKSYFGNMGQGEAKELVFRDCLLEITCFVPELMAFLDANIGSFFVLHNFGTRQSKGFGGFLVEGCNSPLFVRRTIETLCPHHFSFSVRETRDVRTRLNHAYAVYAIMKSGSNLGRGRFIRGFSRRQFLPEGIGSDKAFIKAKVLPSERLHPNESRQDYRSFTFIRAMLGLAENYEFRDDIRNDDFKNVRDRRTGTMVMKPVGIKVQIKHFCGTRIADGKLEIPLDSIKEKKGIQRFQSPIMIKITDNRIFFILNDSWKNMLGQVFLMAPKRKMDEALGRKDPTAAKEMLEEFAFICTPDSFDADRFITEFVVFFNSNETKQRLRKFPEWTTQPFPPAGYEMNAAAQFIHEKGGQG